jgi:hypothetical protein
VIYILCNAVILAVQALLKDINSQNRRSIRNTYHSDAMQVGSVIGAIEKNRPELLHAAIAIVQQNGRTCRPHLESVLNCFFSQLFTLPSTKSEVAVAISSCVQRFNLRTSECD